MEWLKKNKKMIRDVANEENKETEKYNLKNVLKIGLFLIQEIFFILYFVKEICLPHEQP